MKKATGKDFDPSFFLGIAHRGLHGGSISENSLPAFRAAIEKGLPFEFDVHLTKEGSLYVIHDSNLKRLCGVDKDIEKLSDEEISSLRLPNGEKIATLEEVFELNKDFRSLMVVELKVYEGNYKPLAKAVRSLMEGRFSIPRKKAVVISFDPRALWAFGKGYVRELLVCKEKIWTLKLRGFFESLDLDIAVLKDKRVLGYRKRGGIVNSWTYEDKETYLANKDYTDTITYQYFDPLE